MFKRALLEKLISRLHGKRHFIQILSGPRQVGKTTLALQAAEVLEIEHIYASADDPTLHDSIWLENQWLKARQFAKKSPHGALLIIDEIQKVLRWSETCKRLWDEDSKDHIPLRVLLLGSAPPLIQQGLTESLAGRFEKLMVTHWSYQEMQNAFNFSLDEYIYFGGYPGAAILKSDNQRWQQYIKDSLIETTLSRDLLLLQPIHKPALLRRLFYLGCLYSGQIISLQKLLGQLQENGNVTTLAHYLELFKQIWMLCGLQKFSGDVLRQRASSPKLQVFNTALMTAQMQYNFNEAKENSELWGQLVESTVGAYLCNQALLHTQANIFYWREGNEEVDFIFQYRNEYIALEVKSGDTSSEHRGLRYFNEKFKPKRCLLIGDAGISLDVFLSTSILEWFN